MLRDKSVLRISEETEFELATLPEGTERSTEILLHSGALRAKVSKLVTGEARFTVRTDGAILGVRGTDLFVSVDPEGVLQRSLAERLRRNVDMNWAEAEVDRLMKIPEFAELMAAFGVRELLPWEQGGGPAVRRLRRQTSGT